MQTEAALVEAVEKFEVYQDLFNPEYMRSHAAQFSPQIFADRYLDFLNKCKEKRPFIAVKVWIFVFVF